MREGRKVLFKPNLVSPSSIDAATHGEGKGNIACTQWPCVAALMRWFHDRLDIGYHEMALGEAGTGVAGTAAFLTALHGGGERITP